jgi:UDP-3-O-[3-hydroxymyristoyl] N-acetylglucosamine deacetylase/3-hydroxyacyl-[acyl-carrier-protein] dehydratase
MSDSSSSGLHGPAVRSERQHTLGASFSLEGIGLHTGETAQLTVHPADADHGYVFQRMDLEGAPCVPADCDLVVETRRGTTLEKDGARVHTTEHLLAALHGCGIDNALIEMNGPEVPILDGSSWPFVAHIEEVGTVEQEADRHFITLTEPITHRSEDGVEMLAVPPVQDEFRLTVMVDYGRPVLGTQHASMRHLGQFVSEISRCRTFVFLKEVKALLEQGLIKGGDLDNAIVLAERTYSEEEIASIASLAGKEGLAVDPGKTGVLNNTTLQHANEPARHKLLDIIGDLALTGCFIRGHILAARPGHAGNVSFAKELKKLSQAADRVPHYDPTEEPVFDIHDIERLLPHRYPFLLVDKILSRSEDSIVGLKNVTMNEPFFQGHFPGNPVMPGVLQIEAMAQVGGIFALSGVDNPEQWSTYFMKIDNVRFKQKVIPGDTVLFRLKLASPIRRGLVHMTGEAFVGEKLVSQAEMLAQIIQDRVPSSTSA